MQRAHPPVSLFVSERLFFSSKVVEGGGHIQGLHLSLKRCCPPCTSKGCITVKSMGGGVTPKGPQKLQMERAHPPVYHPDAQFFTRKQGWGGGGLHFFLQRLPTREPTWGASPPSCPNLGVWGAGGFPRPPAQLL